MREAIRARALELGFNDCRFAAAARPGNADHFEQWIAAGHHGEMQYLARNAAKRVDPRLVLPDVRTVIVLASVYPGTLKPAGATQASDPPERPVGSVALYARGTDYHEVLRGPLIQFAQFVQEIGGSNTRCLWYVDTGPILERDFGRSAGIGFAGKHTNLVSRRLGNSFLLSEVLTTLELAPDSPEENRCGKCDRCIRACPTNAFPSPFQLDARRCISYLTIELKGSIPEQLRPLVGSRIFGCDDCLAVCPWNRFAQEARLLSAGMRPDLGELDLLELLALDDACFRARFEGTPIMRSKRRGLLRNVCVALGNIGGEAAVPALKKAALDPEPLIMEHATWALDQIQQRSKGMNVGAAF